MQGAQYESTGFQFCKVNFHYFGNIQMDRLKWNYSRSLNCERSFSLEDISSGVVSTELGLSLETQTHRGRKTTWPIFLLNLCLWLLSHSHEIVEQLWQRLRGLRSLFTLQLFIEMFAHLSSKWYWIKFYASDLSSKTLWCCNTDAIFSIGLSNLNLCNGFLSPLTSYSIPQGLCFTWFLGPS